MTQLPPLVILVAVAALVLGAGVMQVSSGPAIRSAGNMLAVPASLIAALAVVTPPEIETAGASAMALLAAAALGIVGATSTIVVMEPALGPAAARWRLRLIGPAIALGVCLLLLLRD
jgi:hypothetical protein